MMVKLVLILNRVYSNTSNNRRFFTSHFSHMHLSCLRRCRM